MNFVSHGFAQYPDRPQLRNVLRGVIRYSGPTTELHLLCSDGVAYGGQLTGWCSPDPDMLPYKRKLEQLPVATRMQNGRRVYIMLDAELPRIS